MLTNKDFDIEKCHKIGEKNMTINEIAKKYGKEVAEDFLTLLRSIEDELTEELKENE